MKQPGIDELGNQVSGHLALALDLPGGFSDARLQGLRGGDGIAHRMTPNQDTRTRAAHDGIRAPIPAPRGEPLSTGWSTTIMAATKLRVRDGAVQLKYGLISVDDHVQEPPDLWTRRLATGGWGNRVPHIEQADDGAERWVADGRVLLHGRVASAGCLMPDRG